MFGVPNPVLILFALAAAYLYMTGKLSIPGLSLPARHPFVPAVAQSPLANVGAPTSVRQGVEQLSQYSAHELALAHAIAERREADQLLAHRVATENREKVQALFMAPYSPPVPAPPAPTPAAPTVPDAPKR